MHPRASELRDGWKFRSGIGVRKASANCSSTPDLRMSDVVGSPGKDWTGRRDVLSKHSSSTRHRANPQRGWFDGQLVHFWNPLQIHKHRRRRQAKIKHRN
jgi:hypothetical protein